MEGKAVLLTFGLLSPNKGIENVIQALPQILSKHKNVVYIVAGATHPHILRREGDKYRASLQALAKEMGVESQVIFHNRFVSPEEMVEFIGAADIYITPYRHEAQVVSGTLAYALGAGKAIISTPYWHAIELLDDRRGALVPFQNPDAIAQKTIELLDTPAIRHAMRKRAYLFAREMVWKRVAQGYMESFARVRSDRMENPQSSVLGPDDPQVAGSVAGVEAESLESDDRRHRNAAALDLHDPEPQRGIHHRRQCSRSYFFSAAGASGKRSACRADRSGNPIRLSQIPPAFICRSWSMRSIPRKADSRTFSRYDRRWNEPVGSEDSHGRALWALGTVLGRSHDQGLQGRGRALVRVFSARSAGIQQSAGVGLHPARNSGIPHSYPGDRDAQKVRSALSRRLLEMYESIRAPGLEMVRERSGLRQREIAPSPAAGGLGMLG